MAEERLIDDDKDRKYKVIKNADGEDELVELPPEENEVTTFEVEERESDDEEAAFLTPEELAALIKAREEREAAIRKELEERLFVARSATADGEYDLAAEELKELDKIAPENGEAQKIKLLVASKNFTDFEDLEGCEEAAEGISKYCTKEQKDELKKLSDPLNEQIEKLKAEVQALDEENERKKQERRPLFIERAKRATKFFTGASAIFVALLIVAAVFASIINAREDGTYVVLTIVFAALAGVAFIVFLVAAHKFWVAKRNVKLNENNSRTKTGRELEKCRTALETLTLVDNSIKGNNDLS